MKIVVLDGHTLNPGDNPWVPLEELGDVTVYPRTATEDIVPRAQDAEIVLVNKTPLTAETLSQLPNLRYIGVLATGFDVVDLEAAGRRGIPVCNVPGYATNAVAQYVFAMILELDHHIRDHDASVKAGLWAASEDWCFWNTPQIELTGQTMGIIGFGAIGSRVSELAHAFGMKVLACTRTPKPVPDYAPFSYASIEEVFEQADVISLHCPLTADNERFVNADLLSRMKPEALFINTARGRLVDEHALAAALAAGKLRGAALDVVSAEPISSDNPLLSAPGCILTPHIAWASLTARQNLMRQAGANVRAYLAGRPANVVNDTWLAR
ncbi:glycerate dehydrogenase [Desulfobaculum xiamenense]|uniref:Glycerate dehydrogenase n=1 Tax=Desulfobaculum xiamenense TaxID=995050 RepID=A0A846QRP1_9BACT|nr:D-2-hydroxyacid dehydrogenase [Desulfobaculum xiamenense]NJB69033.1 glycerate dehydrogenase [Desulfobaculum xiamenense]